MPALGTREPVSVQYLDYSGERKSVQLFAGEITAVSLPGFLTELSDLEDALNAVTLGTESKSSWGAETILSNTRPTDKDAQVETEMLVTYQDATTEAPYSFRIPTVDYTAFNYADPPAGDSVILRGAGASAATTALIDAIEAIGKSPSDDSHAIVVTGMRVVR
jgi:hypothetical protein